MELKSQDSPLEEITIEKLRRIAELCRNPYPNLAGYHRIPETLLEINPKAYRPRFVSLGPFHSVGYHFNRSKDINILAMEGTKHEYMLSLLDDTLYSEQVLSSCKKYVKNNLLDICNFYHEKPDAASELLGRNVLVDACFLLEFLRRMLLPSIPVETDSSMFSSLRRDAALLENQLPFFVIHQLSIIIKRHHSEPKEPIFYFNGMLSLVKLTPEVPTSVCIEKNIKGCPHLLGLVTGCHLSVVDPTPASAPSFHLRSATQLIEAGVRIERADGTKLLALEFANGVLKIPALVIHDSTETLLINLLAYENLNARTVSSEGYLASYVMLMMHLVQTKKDLELLEKQGIIVNELGSGKNGSQMFYDISMHVILGSFRFENLCQQTEAFANSRRRRYMVDFTRLYFQNPWTAASLFAAVLLLVLATLQTVYTILSFYQKPH